MIKLKFQATLFALKLRFDYFLIQCLFKIKILFLLTPKYDFKYYQQLKKTILNVFPYDI